MTGEHIWLLLSVMTKSMPLVEWVVTTTKKTTMESIQVSSLLETMETSMMRRQNNNQWTRLQCHLSSPQFNCAAVVVHNRYIVILGCSTMHQ